MKHHVLLGLILGLMATAKLGGQVLPVLFDVEFDGLTVRVKSRAQTGVLAQNPAALFTYNENTLQNDIPVTSTSGITLMNLFPLNYTTGSTTGSGNNLALSNGTTVDLTFFDVLSVTMFALPAGVANNGLNLNLYSAFQQPEINFSSASSFSVVGGRQLEFTVSNPLSVPNYTDSQNGASYVGPLHVYAGYNSAFGGASLIGTYTITAVPEPSTYAAIAGGLGLLAAVLHRRRQRARATAA